MADPVGFEGVNFTFAAPKGMEDTVRDLHVAKFEDHTASCWRLTPEELATVAKTGVVWLRIMGHSMPPVYVSGEALVLIEGRPSKAEPFLERTKTVAADDLTKTCEACDNTNEHENFCEGCGCCSECCNCTDTDCDCDTCVDRRKGE